MSDYINIYAMDEAIAEYKKAKREAIELKLLDLFSQIVTEYKKYNPEGEYLDLSYVDGTLCITNAYSEEDAEHPINAIIYGKSFEEDAGKFSSIDIKRGGKEDE